MEKNLQHPVSRLWLESLSTGELIEIADNYGIDIPAELERIFIVEEILESAQSEFDSADEKLPGEDIVINPSHSETVPLPKKYNISYLEVIIRDPLWAFVFWEIKSHDREMHENAPDFKGYYLQVIPLNEDETEQQAKKNSFTVPVNAQDCARYLGFAEHTSENPGHYIIKLIALRGDTEWLIAPSQSFDLPKLYEDESLAEMKSNELVRLSGVQDLAITKNSDRQSRIKRQ